MAAVACRSRTLSNGRVHALTRRRLCCHAFQSVFQCRQTKYGVFLQWLAASMASAHPRGRVEREQLVQAVSA